MNKILKKATEEWMQLERKTYEQRKQAEDYYEKNLMKLILDDYIKRNKVKVYEKVRYLVVSVGTSYEPIVLNISLLKPEKILFLYTEKSAKILDKIVNFCGLGMSSVDKSLVSETDPLAIYREIKRAYLNWERPDKMYIDFTGGTKSMSAAAAMAGAMVDVQLVYVGTNDYLTDFRKPNPGSETLYYIANPLSVFGDLEIEKAFMFFGQYNFAGSRIKLESLKENIPDPEIRQQLNFVWLLAKAYEAWDSLDFLPAHESMLQLAKEIKRDSIHTDYLMVDMQDKIAAQLKILDCLNKIPTMIREKKNAEILKNCEIISCLMFSMYQNALTRERQDKYDMATLLLYRLLEMIEQRRLAVYGLFVSKMDYSKILQNKVENPKYRGVVPDQVIYLLKDDIADIKNQLFRKPGSTYLPDQVSLLEGFMILHAFHDPIVYSQEMPGINSLKRIRSMVYLRNNSIFAHGLGPVEKDDYMKFRTFVEEMFVKFCEIEGIAFYKITNNILWIDPTESENYSKTLGDSGCQ